MAAASWVEGPSAVLVSVIAMVIGVCIAGYNIVRHAQNYNFPRTQKYIFRILFIVPVYSICSCAAIIAPSVEAVVVFLTVRDVYEAFVVYSFLTLILEYGGGDYNCIEQIKHLPPIHPPIPLCFLPAVRRNGTLLRLCKQATLQFVVVKPFMAALSLIALAMGQYFSHTFQVLLLAVYNTSYMVALYGLLVFYTAMRPLLTPFKPVLKFLAVKSIIFFTYWQSVLVQFYPGITQEQSLLWNDFILCVEMIGFGLLLNFAFPWKEFVMGPQDKPVLENVRDMLSVRDVFQDAYHSFMPSYQDYVVARDDHDKRTGAAEAARSRKIRTRTFLVGNLDKMNVQGGAGAAAPQQPGESPGAREAGHSPQGEEKHEAEAGHDGDGDGMGVDDDWTTDVVDIIELPGSGGGGARARARPAPR